MKNAAKKKALVTKSKMKTAKAQLPTKKAAAPSGDRDLIQLILEDHKPLKKLIKILKDLNKSLDERQNAFEEFAPLLVSHAKPEEQTMYNFLKEGDDDIRTEGFEGDVEHGLADQMIEEANRTDDEDLWSARVKVLAELVEHHLQEEEKSNGVLHDFKKNSDLQDRIQLGRQYTELKALIESNGGKDAPSEEANQSQIFN